MTETDRAWAICRVRRNQQMAETNAGYLGVRLLKGHGFPDEVMCDAQDALAIRIVLDHVRDLEHRLSVLASIRHEDKGLTNP